MNNPKYGEAKNNLNAMTYDIISCDFEGCTWFGRKAELLYHKDNECEDNEYLREKCRNLQLTITLMKQQQQQQHDTVSISSTNNALYHPGRIQYYHPMALAATQRISYHPGKLLTNKIHPGFKIFDNVRKVRWKHEWIEKHRGQRINAGIYNGYPLIQWSCCDNKWDNNTANGCIKVCKKCGIDCYKDSNDKRGCIKVEETIKMVLWTCCKVKEEMSSFNSKGCQAVYSCCNQPESDNGCQYKLNMNESMYQCCGGSIYDNNNGCQTKWSCCNQSVSSIGCYINNNPNY